jgi:hypothetical protein
MGLASLAIPAPSFGFYEVPCDGKSLIPLRSSPEIFRSFLLTR